MINAGRYPVLGVGINALDYAAAVETIIEAAWARRPLAVSALAVHGVMTGVLDPEHRHRLNALDLAVPDGQPVRWALRWRHGVHLPERVHGPTLMMALCERAANEQLPVYFYGSRPEILQRLTDNLKRKSPRLLIAGTMPSRFRALTPEEQAAAVTSIAKSGARLVFVGLGCPRQEIWAYEHKSLLSMPVVAVGAAFDYHAGTLRQAPHWMQRYGLEWFYRLMQEPRRLWRRYLLLNPVYVALLAAEATGLARFDSGSPAPPARLRVG
jgi:N-acetylglucosaminyldiphosphoundecaprenol N-acetyl-beta-D-mannosaminyltransferase